MKPPLLLLALGLAMVAPAAARASAYCNGDVIAVIFDTSVVPGPAGRASYSVRLLNRQPQPRRLVVNVMAPFLGRPTPAPISLAPGMTKVVALGYQPNLPGSPPLRGERLEQVTRVSCL